MEKNSGIQTGSEIRVLAIFARLHHISLTLHKIAASDSVKHLVELKPRKKFFWPKLGPKWSFLF